MAVLTEIVNEKRMLTNVNLNRTVSMNSRQF